MAVWAGWTFIPGPKAPEDAPNVLVVLIDDAGSGGPPTFGGPISTPNLIRVPEMGITCHRFHVTAVCSPTRACLLTGRNQHRGPLAAVVGFDHRWGFLSGAAGQYDPIITQGNSTLGVPEGEDGKQYYFPDDLAGKAFEWLHAVRAQDATRPWMMYYSTGCSHAPHHVPKQWADKYQGEFDDAWDSLRERTFERQKRLGIVPQDTELTDQRGMIPRIIGRSYAIEAELHVPEGGAEGVIVAYADFTGGFALWADDDGRLRHTCSLLGVEICAGRPRGRKDPAPARPHQHARTHAVGEGAAG